MAVDPGTTGGRSNYYQQAQVTITGANSTGATLVWNNWATNTAITSGVTTTMTNDLIWNDWADCTCAGHTGNEWRIWTNHATTATTTATTVWADWVDTRELQLQAAMHNTRRILGAPAVIKQRTEAEVQAELKQREAYKKEQERLALERAAARARATKLLMEHLTPEQRKELEEKNCFYLYTQSGGRYRIDRGTHGNVKVLDKDNKIVATLCGQPNGVPDEDAMLAQVLMLRTNEQQYRRVANERPWRG